MTKIKCFIRLVVIDCNLKSCETCRIELFKASVEGIQCPFCRTLLKKKDITEKNREEIEFENEMRIRELLKME